MHALTGSDDMRRRFESLTTAELRLLIDSIENSDGASDDDDIIAARLHSELDEELTLQECGADDSDDCDC